jgi:hypothetical protein
MIDSEVGDAVGLQEIMNRTPSYHMCPESAESGPTTVETNPAALFSCQCMIQDITLESQQQLF